MTNDSKEKRSDDEKDEALPNVSDDNHNSNAASPSEYSRFTKNEKWFIVCFTSFVGVFRCVRGVLLVASHTQTSNAASQSAHSKHLPSSITLNRHSVP
jgi:hypothetical protein